MTPKEALNITLVQSDVKWEEPVVNLKHFEHLLESVHETDLIVLPEMFSTGFSMQPKTFAEAMEGPSMQWMHQQSIQHNAVVTGSLIIEENGAFYNRLIWMPPNGTYEVYDKRHLFSFAQEEEHYTAGNKRIIVFLKGWRICPLICYDLRFPAWIRNQDWKSRSTNLVYDLLLIVANWPATRAGAWTNLLEARAHENQCYVAGVNRIGDDGNGIPHSGDSRLIGPKGELISTILPNQQTVNTYALSYSELKRFREKFTAWKDSDNLSLFL